MISRTFWVLVCLIMMGCGPVEGPDTRTLKVRVVNHYAESLFSIGYQYTDAMGVQQSANLFSRERVSAGASTTTEVKLPSSASSKVTLTVVATSLGQDRSFPPLEIDILGHSFDTYTIGYSYDLATASFAIEHGWNCFSCLTSGASGVKG